MLLLDGSGILDLLWVMLGLCWFCIAVGTFVFRCLCSF